MPVLNEPNAFCQPCLIVALHDLRRTLEVCRAFRRLGWDVYEARSGPEVRRLAHLLEADCAVLDANLSAESGWLTCAKLVDERPEFDVVLLAESPGPRDRHLARFVGARLVDCDAGLSALIAAVAGPAEVLLLAGEK